MSLSIYLTRWTELV